MKCQNCGKEGSGDVCAACGGTIEESPRWYAEGIAYLTEQQMLDNALELLEEGIKRYPDSAMLWFNGGVLEEMRNNRDGAILRYRKVLELRPNRDKARKALERLLGHSLDAPGEAPAVGAITPVAVTPAPEFTLPDIPPTPASIQVEEPVVLPMKKPAAELPAAAPAAVTATTPIRTPKAPASLPPSPGSNGSKSASPKVDLSLELPVSLPLAEPSAASARWATIRLICGIGSIVAFLLLAVALIGLKNSLLFGIALLLSASMLILYFVASANAHTPRQRRR